ncbi:hypothetical protein [Sinisalibacter aestuarii]|uniref:DUF304 domain-containing protein n=1 Tax=Sinisalibacter aestuarii TaxID=2949426 RepID=A0ABQ5LUK7_9RHOB|nr:hypothetical protein [Sinisalibacter aestuarii]GKY88654.1 hypothetical protein STA1M1_25230 [Sinisalibacter aestuarii]
MADTTFPVLPARKRAKLIQLVTYAVFGAAALVLALIGPWGWIGWLVGGALLGLAVGKAVSLVRMRYVAKVTAAGVTVCLPSGREMQARWGEIQAHTIDPEKGLGGLVVGPASGGRVRIVPIATRDMGPEAAKELLAALKTRLPRLEYRVPTMGKG